MELILLALFILFYHFYFIGKPFSKLRYFRFRFCLLENFIKIRLFFIILIIDRQIKGSLFCTRLRNVSFFKDIGERLICGHLSHLDSVWTIIVNLSWSWFENNFIFTKILVNWSAYFWQFFWLLISSVQKEQN